MARLQRKRFEQPVEVRHFPHGQLDIVELDDVVVGRMTHEPGWRWSVDVRPIAGTDRCQYHHVGYTIQGRLHTQLEDGAELILEAGDVFELPPGHDAWVEGDENWVALDFAGVRSYAQPADQRGQRILASLLFSDIVGSTALAERLGAAAGTSGSVSTTSAPRRSSIATRGASWTSPGMASRRLSMAPSGRFVRHSPSGHGSTSWICMSAWRFTRARSRARVHAFAGCRFMLRRES